MPKESILKKRTKEISILTERESSLIYDAAKMTLINRKPRFRYGYAYVLILNTGLRCGEALALTWDCVDFDKNTIKVNKSVATIQNRNAEEDSKTLHVIGDVKTKHGNRIISLNERTKEALLFYHQLQERARLSTEHVICTNTGLMCQTGEFQRMLNSILSLQKINHVGIHALRHTFASHLLSSGADIKVVSKLLGHSSVTITYNTYIHPTINDSISAVQLLNAL